MSDRYWSLAQLRSELERYEAELRAAGKEQRTIDTYVGQSERFVRFLIADYRPGRTTRSLGCRGRAPAAMTVAAGSSHP